jgi:lipopolysaccharide/colanic/teichoic acid biosynthesis glycosyltransferase
MNKHCIDQDEPEEFQPAPTGPEMWLKRIHDQLAWTNAILVMMVLLVIIAVIVSICANCLGLLARLG